MSTNESANAVSIEFDCIPMRTVSRYDVPVDASPGLEKLMRRMRDCVQKHGTHNTYYLHRGKCVFYLTNDPEQGRLEFEFDGVILTDENDVKTRGADLEVTLLKETCPWINQSIVQWFHGTVARAVEVEFDRYIQAGDLQRTQQRLAEMQQQEQASGGYLGMYL